MDILHIRYKNGRGEAKVVLDNFFPTTLARFKLLLKIIELVDEYEDKVQHLKRLKSHLKNRIFIVENYNPMKKKVLQENKSLQNCLNILNNKYHKYFEE